MTLFDHALVRRCAGALVIAPLLAATPAVAGPADDAYIAARDRAVAEVTRLDGDPAKQDAMFAADEKARAALQKQIAALLGPLSFKGLEPEAAFSPGALYPGDLESGQPDGLVFRDSKDNVRVFVSTVPIIEHWMAIETKAGVPDLDKGLSAALANDTLYTFTVGQDAAFRAYAVLPLPAPEGETVFAAVGLFSQDDTNDFPPRDIVVARIAKDRLTIGAEAAPEARKAIAACTQIWKRHEAKAKQLQAAAQKGKGADDPRWDEAVKAWAEGSDAFRACYAQEAPKQPFFPALVTRATALLKRMGGG
ncbi:MAG: hypothetical protein AB1698_12295 [Pseudomonadota bacterium]